MLLVNVWICMLVNKFIRISSLDSVLVRAPEWLSEAPKFNIQHSILLNSKDIVKKTLPHTRSNILRLEKMRLNGGQHEIVQR